MNLTPVVPIVLIVFFWAIVFVACFVSFARMLRLPTEPEIEEALDHTSAEDGAQTPTH
ncbi:MAG: hypothetical protein ACLQUY_24030 [Ktedonobacterales bacterium]